MKEPFCSTSRKQVILYQLQPELPDIIIISNNNNSYFSFFHFYSFGCCSNLLSTKHSSDYYYKTFTLWLSYGMRVQFESRQAGKCRTGNYSARTKQAKLDLDYSCSSPAVECMAWHGALNYKLQVTLVFTQYQLKKKKIIVRENIYLGVSGSQSVSAMCNSLFPSSVFFFFLFQKKKAMNQCCELTFLYMDFN